MKDDTQQNLQPNCNQVASDCISRQAAIKAADSIIERDTSGNNDVVKAMTAWKEYIKELPSAQPGWIPVTERLPEYFVPVLTWDGQDQCVEMRIPYIITTEGETIKSDWWCGDYWEDKEESLYHPHDLRDGAALAWMPLPTPWEGGQNDGKN